MFEIRRYCPPDREAVWTLVADTAFFGEPVEAFFDDRRLYGAAFAAYYTDYEPERLWVAERAGSVVGCLMGCGDSRRRMRISRTRILPAVLSGVLQGHYRIGTKTLRHILRMAQEYPERSIPTVPLERFPGHLHVNVAAPARGQGIGRALLEAALAQFWETGVRGVHLLTTDRNPAACHLYETLGFRLLDARPTRRWRGLVAGRVENRAYGINKPFP